MSFAPSPTRAAATGAATASRLCWGWPRRPRQAPCGNHPSCPGHRATSPKTPANLAHTSAADTISRHPCSRRTPVPCHAPLRRHPQQNKNLPWGICSDVSSQVARKQRCLDRGYRPSTNRTPEDSMRDFSFLVVLPRPDQGGSRIVAQVDAAARCVVEARGSNLPPAYQRHHKPVRQRA